MIKLKPGDRIIVIKGPNEGTRGHLKEKQGDTWTITPMYLSQEIKVLEKNLELTKPFVLDYWLP